MAFARDMSLVRRGLHKGEILGFNGHAPALALGLNRKPEHGRWLAILNLTLEKATTRDELNDYLNHIATDSPLQAQIGFSQSPEAVSSDLVGDFHAGTIDARATVVAADQHSPAPRAIVGGTSSIVGEKSVHIGDVSEQTRETLDNIEALLIEAGASGLEALHHVRVYYIDPADAEVILDHVNQRMPHLAGEVEMFHAPLCRPDLGVEIEGLADA